ncbi:MAG: cytochrome c family protein [Hyphomicrobiales bacterium]
MLRTIGFAAIAIVTLASSPALAGDAAAGQKVFAKCKACHEAGTATNKVGPTLKGLFGRKAGTVEGYPYSDAMKSSGIVWNEDTLKTYLADPKAMVPGTKMTFVGLKKPEDVENVISYLEEATK